MSRSRRKIKRSKCSCGRHEIAYDGMSRRGRPVADCPVLGFPFEHNDRRARFLAKRDAPVED